jgi:hypothetical protein
MGYQGQPLPPFTTLPRPPDQINHSKLFFNDGDWVMMGVHTMFVPVALRDVRRSADYLSCPCGEICVSYLDQCVCVGTVSQT